MYTLLICLSLSGYYQKQVYNQLMYMDDTSNRFFARSHKDELIGRTVVLGFDLVYSCLKAGIGGDGNFFSDCGKGALGGAVAFGAEQLASYSEVYPGAATSGRLLHALGVSMTDNITEGLGLFDRFQFDAGPIVLTWTGNWKPQLRFDPVPALVIGYYLLRGNKFDIERSVIYLTPVLYAETDGFPQNGQCFGNVIMYQHNPVESFSIHKAVLSHELNHVLFYEHLRIFGNKWQAGGIEIGRPIIGSIAGGMSYLFIHSDCPECYTWMPQEFTAYAMEQFPNGKFIWEK